jgi:hypothetical protein
MQFKFIDEHEVINVTNIPPQTANVIYKAINE